MKPIIALFLLLLSSFGALADDGVFAEITTNKGTITAKLFWQKTPLTVINFAALAQGNKKNNFRSGQPFYDGLTFHRVIDDFMIQGGDPQGDGRGGPGYAFADEFDAQLKHDKAGILSMANAGPNTNGSQFFITHRDTPWLDGRHSVFGEVTSGMDVVNRIKQGDIIEQIRIIKKGDKAQQFIANEQTFNQQQAKYFAVQQKKHAADMTDLTDYVKKNYPNAQKTDSGLYYVVLKNGQGAQAKKGDFISAHYTLELTDGTVLSSSYQSQQPLQAVIGVGQLIKAWDEAVLDMKVGEKRVLIAPYFLAYGEQGRPPIPPKATLIFELELLAVKSPS